LKKLGFSFILIKGGGSLYVDSFYQCSCGQKWKEKFVEAMQYNIMVIMHGQLVMMSSIYEYRNEKNLAVVLVENKFRKSFIFEYR
tara:strand:+ start:1081 stop:1335 length:255 start_codon:yes stop_codon:yes gene_type:complete